MTFLEVVDQVLSILERRRRVSKRAIQAGVPARSEPDRTAYGYASRIAFARTSISPASASLSIFLSKTA